MTRNEQIWQQALVKAKENPDDFVRGAEWADENPKSKYNISDTDLVDEAQHTTTGNVAHNARSIMALARNALKYIKKNE